MTQYTPEYPQKGIQPQAAHRLPSVKCDILYSDEHIIVCVKPSGIQSESPGMPDILSAQLSGEVYCVHRLDKDVGGVMVFARDKKTAGILSAGSSEYEKEYLAVVEGEIYESDILEDLLFHDKVKNKTYIVKRIRSGVKEALLSYRRLAYREGLSLAKVTLKTGRTHQIRVQFASRKWPLQGDRKYGSTISAPHIALWAWKLTFIYPGRKKQMSFSRLPPLDETWSAWTDVYPSLE